MYTLEEYKRIQTDIEYQKEILWKDRKNIFKIHKQTEEFQLYFLNKNKYYFAMIKFPTNESCIKILYLYPRDIRYINGPSEKMIWKSIKKDIDCIKYINIIKWPDVFKYYQFYYNGLEEDKFTLEKFKLINYDLDYQKENYRHIHINQILSPSFEIIDFYIENKDNLDDVSSGLYLTESHQNKILDIDSDYFKYFKFPTLDIIYKAIDLDLDNIKYVDLDKFPEIYEYWRLLTI